MVALLTNSIRLCSLMVKQRIYIPCATDNWPMWVRLPPEAPMTGVSIMDNTASFYLANVGSIPARRTK